MASPDPSELQSKNPEALPGQRMPVEDNTVTHGGPESYSAQDDKLGTPSAEAIRRAKLILDDPHIIGTLRKVAERLRNSKLIDHTIEDSADRQTTDDDSET